jgi:hypothetical protein
VERPGAVKGAWVLGDGVDSDVADELLQVFAREGISAIATAVGIPANGTGSASTGQRRKVRSSEWSRRFFTRAPELALNN